MKYQYLPLLLILLIPLTGCTDEVKETLNPDLDFKIESFETRSETEEGYKPISDHTWLFITMKITNNNEEGPVPITAYHFYLTYPDEVWCRGFEGDEEPNIQPGESALFTIYFEIDDEKNYEWMEYRRTLEDPIQIVLPEPGS